jgi:hypothetical protein
MVKAVVKAVIKIHHRTNRKFWDLGVCPSEAHVLSPLLPMSLTSCPISISTRLHGTFSGVSEGFASPAVRRHGRDDRVVGSCVSARRPLPRSQPDASRSRTGGAAPGASPRVSGNQPEGCRHRRKEAVKRLAAPLRALPPPFAFLSLVSSLSS